uniref:Uncharacterized protein n=1 Tax=Paramormyrops kingsleyae TaxID=1676925 RepID=A0A3B3RTC2_9TELE
MAQWVLGSSWCTTMPSLSCCNEISPKWTLLPHHFFHFDIRGVFNILSALESLSQVLAKWVVSLTNTNNSVLCKSVLSSHQKKLVVYWKFYISFPLLWSLSE